MPWNRSRPAAVDVVLCTLIACSDSETTAVTTTRVASTVPATTLPASTTTSTSTTAATTNQVETGGRTPPPMPTGPAVIPVAAQQFHGVLDSATVNGKTWVLLVSDGYTTLVRLSTAKPTDIGPRQSSPEGLPVPSAALIRAGDAAERLVADPADDGLWVMGKGGAHATFVQLDLADDTPSLPSVWIRAVYGNGIRYAVGPLRGFTFIAVDPVWGVLTEYELDTTRTRSYDLGASGCCVLTPGAVTDQDIWLLSRADPDGERPSEMKPGTLVWLHRSSGVLQNVSEELGLGPISTVAAVGTNVWFSLESGGIGRFDTVTGTLADGSDLPWVDPDDTYGLAAGPNDTILVDHGGDLLQIHPTSGVVIATVARAFSGTVYAMDDVVTFDDAAYWLTPDGIAEWQTGTDTINTIWREPPCYDPRSLARRWDTRTLWLVCSPQRVLGIARDGAPTLELFQDHLGDPGFGDRGIVGDGSLWLLNGTSTGDTFIAPVELTPYPY